MSAYKKTDIDVAIVDESVCTGLLFGINSWGQSKRLTIGSMIKTNTGVILVMEGKTIDTEEDRFYQQCLKQMKENDCRHVYDKELRAFNVIICRAL